MARKAIETGCRERQQAVAIIPAVVEDILETAVVGDINETTAARK
jgi:hypothetical protein